MTEWQKRKRVKEAEKNLSHSAQQLARTFEALGPAIEDLKNSLKLPRQDAEVSAEEIPPTRKSLKK